MTASLFGVKGEGHSVAKGPASRSKRSLTIKFNKIIYFTRLLINEHWSCTEKTFSADQLNTELG